MEKLVHEVNLHLNGKHAKELDFKQQATQDTDPNVT